MIDHTFAITAYKESPYLEECIKSLINQTFKSKIIITTSTPNDYIKEVSSKYNIEMFVNEKSSGIANDWNFALSKIDTKYATIAHQDDIYFKNYTKDLYSKVKSLTDVILYCTNYAEIKNGKIIKTNINLTIKRIGMFLLKYNLLNHSKFLRRRILSLGNMISCPTVTYNLDCIDSDLFRDNLKCSLDWQAWELLSRKDGRFVYNSNILMAHRIHKDSETSKILNNNGRSSEDYYMFLKFWPKIIALFLSKIYKKSEKSNDI